MIWDQLLSQPEEVVLPWMGGQTAHSATRRFTLSSTPPEHGWHRFRVDGSRRATWISPDLPPFDPAPGAALVRGYCVGDRLIPDDAAVPSDPHAALSQSEKVWLLDPSLDRFARVVATRHRDGRLLYLRQDLPLGPEPDVQAAWHDNLPSISHIPAVTPPLDLTFRWLTRQRAAADARREALARREQAAQATQAALQQAATLRARRAQHFTDAARAALATSGATLLDARPAHQPTERVVQFRFQNRRFECVVHAETLRVIDAGICLIDHATDERGDAYFTLESLPAVIHEAMRRGVLVVFRHAG